MADSPHMIKRFTAFCCFHQISVAELVSKTKLTEKDQLPSLYIQIAAPLSTPCDASWIKQAFNNQYTELKCTGHYKAS